MKAACLLLTLSACFAGVALADDCTAWPPTALCTMDPGTPVSVNAVPEITVEQGEYNYFTITLPQTLPESISIALSVVNGDPDLYVKRGLDSEPSLGNFDYSSRSSANEDVVTIPLTDVTAGESLGVAVHGFRTSTYTLLYSDGTAITLINGLPQTGSVAQRAYQYFTFEMNQPGNPIVVTVTTLTGDPDVLVNRGSTPPTLQSAQWSELSIGDDVISIPIPADEPTGPYTIGVYGSVNSEFIVAVSQNKIVTLLDGLPHGASLENGVSAFFQLRALGGTNQPVTISFTVEQGALEYYVLAAAPSSTSTVSRTNKNWEGTADFFTPTSLQIRPGEEHYLDGGGVYQVLVVGNTPLNVHQNTTFTVVAKTAQALAPLQDGQPTFDSVSANSYRYYSMSVSDVSLGVVFDITPSAGDPDMFISCNKTLSGDDTGFPSRMQGHYTWQSTQWGEDTVRIDPSDTNSCVHTTPQGGTFFIAVYGFSNASYSITAALDNGIPTTLVIGQPQNGMVYQGLSNEYWLHMPAIAKDLVITVSPSYGDPDLYVTVDGTEPSRSNYAYRSATANGADGITVSSNQIACNFDEAEKCYCTDCRIRILVEGFTTSAYAITAVTNDAVLQLLDGFPVVQIVAANTYKYYQFSTPDNGDAVQFTVTPIAGDSDLAISRTINRPTLGNADYVSVQIGGDVITIPDADAGDFYIGVYGFSNSTYTLSAHIISGGSNKQLIGGVPQAGVVDMEEYQYYTVLVDEATDVTVTATPAGGQILLVANKCEERVQECNKARPTIDNNPTWTAEDSFSQESIVIRSNDPNACSQCVYVVGVYGKTPANFTVVVSNSARGMTTLPKNTPFRDYVNQWQYEYFRFQVNNLDQDVIISITPFTGDPDVYVTACGYSQNHPTTEPLPDCVSRPSNHTYTWKHANIGADNINIPAVDPDACIPQEGLPCDYYIAVHGYTASSFSIVARVHSDEPLLLLNGKPQNGHVNTSVIDRYMMEIPAGVDEIQTSLIPRAGDADLYLTLDGTPPTTDHYDRRSISAFGNDLISIRSTDDVFIDNHCDTGCTLLIAVVGYQSSDYTIVASTSRASLLPGVPSPGSVRRGQYAYYHFSVDTDVAMSFVVTPLTGDPDLYVGFGPDYIHPNQSHYIWRSSTLGTDVVDVYPPPIDMNACDVSMGPCNYYIAVLGYSDENSFTIMASMYSKAPVDLIDGQPQTGRVDVGLMKHYRFRAPAGWQAVQISLTPLAGDADLYLSVGGDAPATRTHYDRKSSAVSGNEIITIDANDGLVSTNCPDRDVPCAMNIGVYGYTNATFTLTVGGGARQLQDGVSLISAANQGEYVYYIFHNDDPDTALSFALTPFSGDPDLYVSTTNPKPSSTNATWASAGLGRDVVEIQPDDPNACAPPCNYYLGVTSFSRNSTFSLLASQASQAIIRLIDGRPQLAGIGHGSTKEYVLEIPAGTPTVIITLTPLYGDADLYVNLRAQTPTHLDADYRSIASSDDDSIVISSEDPAYQTSECNPELNTGDGLCAVRIAAYGFSELTFYAIVASSANAQRLVDGNPVRDTAPAGVFRQYMYSLDEENVEVVFTLTPISGDPDMYVSTLPNANSSNHMWRAASTGVDIVEIYPDEENACDELPCQYYIGISGYQSEAQYSLLATTRNAEPTVLLNGRPQTGSVNSSRSEVYLFEIPATSSFSVTLTPTFGDPDLYMRLDGKHPTRTFYQYESITSDGSDSITVTVDDPNFRNCSSFVADGHKVCQAYIAVFGFSASQYAITATVADSNVALREGVSADGVVSEGDYKYFVYTAKSEADLTFTLTPLNGDPDLYVANFTKPKATHTQWFSNGLAVEGVTLSRSDPEVAACPLPCTYYLGVTAFRGTAAFRLLASEANSTQYVTLQTGRPQRGQVRPLAFNYYLFQSPADSKDLRFTVTPLQGVVQLFVNNEVDPSGNVIFPTADCDNGPPCRVTHARWNAFQSSDRATISIPAGSAEYCAGCFYAIAVGSGSVSAGAEFSVVASVSDGLINLPTGLPHTSNVAEGDTDYYRVIITDPTKDVEVSVTMFSGDPDLYVSWHPSNTRPSATNNDLASYSRYNDTVYIQAQELETCQSTTVGGRACQLFLAVKGIEASYYSIVVTTGSDYLNPVYLRVGTPQTAEVRPKTFSYFAAWVDLPENTAFMFTLSTSYGDADMYVSSSDFEPGPSHYNFTSTSSGFDSILIVPGETGYCNHCLLNIAVFGFAADSTSKFTILYTTNTTSSLATLRDGSPQIGFLSAGQYDYYSLYVDDSQADITLSLSPLSGQPEVFVLLGTETTAGGYDLPNKDHSTWSSQGQGNHITQIHHTDPGFQSPATYVIAVYSALASQYLLTASLSRENLVTLHDGQPMIGSVDAGSYTYYSFSVGTTHTVITFNVDNPALLLYATNLYDSTGAIGLPTSDSYVWTSADNKQAQNVLIIPADDPNKSASNIYYTVGVYSATATSFSITASSARAIKVLLSGVSATRQSVATGETVYYRVDLNDPPQDLILSLTPLTGDPDLFVSTTSQSPGCVYPPEAPDTPSCGNFTWSATGTVRDVIHIRAQDPCASPPATSTCTPGEFRPGPVYIGVFGKVGSRFDITATLAGVSTLVPGQPMNTLVTENTPAFFMFRVTDVASRPSIKFDIDVTNSTGLIAYINACTGTCANNEDQPAPGRSTWSAVLGQGANPVFISEGDVNYCTPSTGKPCLYYIGLYPRPSCASLPDGCTVYFQIRASVQDGSGIASINYPDVQNALYAQGGVVQSASSSKYELWLGREGTGSDITMFLEACRGPAASPQLYVCDTTCTEPANPSKDVNQQHRQFVSTQTGGVGRLTFPNAQEVLYATVNTGGDRPSRVLTSALRRALSEEELSSIVIEPTEPYSSRLLSYAGLSVGQTDSWSYILRVSAAPVPYAIKAPTTTITISHPSATDGGRVIVGLGLSWNPVIIEGTTPINTPPATYYVYATPASSGWGEGVVATPCGLQSRVDLLQLTTRQTEVTLDNLDPMTEYEVTIVAACDAQCWASAGMQPSDLYLDRVAYQASRGYTPDAAPSSSGPPIVPIVLAVVAVVVLAVIGGVVYWMRRQGQRQYQYELYDVSGVDGTYSTTAGAYTAMD